MEPLPGESIARAKAAPLTEKRLVEDKSDAGFAALHVDSGETSSLREESASITAPESDGGSRESGTTIHQVGSSYDRYDKGSQADENDPRQNLIELSATPDASGEMESAEASVELGEMADESGTSGDLSLDPTYDETANAPLSESSDHSIPEREDAGESDGPEFPPKMGTANHSRGSRPCKRGYAMIFARGCSNLDGTAGPTDRTIDQTGVGDATIGAAVNGIIALSRVGLRNLDGRN